MFIRPKQKSKVRLVVKKARYGKGVFAGQAFGPGDFLVEFKGKIFKRSSIPEPYSCVEDHFVQISKDCYMGPSGEMDDYINHSCDPNSGLVIRGKRVYLFAIKNINSGDEVVWDYSTTMDEDGWEMECKCRAKRCRKKIRDYKYLPKLIRKRYEALGIVPGYAVASCVDKPVSER